MMNTFIQSDACLCMAELSNHVVQQTNINFIPDGGFRLSDVNLTDIGRSMMDIYGADNEPAITQLPELAVVSLPSVSINITFLPQNGRIVVTDESITAYNGRNSDNFLRLIMALKEAYFCEECNLSVSAFGQNVISTFDLINGDETVDSGEYIYESFLDENESFSELGEILASGFMIAYKDDDFRYQLRLDPRFGKNNSPTKSVRVNFNVHSDNSFPEDITTLTTFWNNSYTKLDDDLSEIIN